MQLDQIVLPTGEKVDPAEWTTTPLYSTGEFQIGVALAPIVLFSYGRGNSQIPISPATLPTRQANDADTNMEGQGGILPENERIILYSIQIELINLGPTFTEGVANAGDDFTATAPDMSLDMMLQCQRDMLAILTIASRAKEYCRAPLGYFAGAVGVDRINQPNAQNNLAPPATPAATGFKVAYNSGISPDDNRDFASPHDIPGGTPFAVTLQFPFGGINTLGTSGHGTSPGAGNIVRARCYLYGFRKRPVA